MFLVSHDIYCSYCPSPCFPNWFPLTWDDSTISRNVETRNYFCVQFAEVFSVVCQFLDKNNVKLGFFAVMFSSKKNYYSFVLIL